jgi:hypothetical protein
MSPCHSSILFSALLALTQFFLQGEAQAPVPQLVFQASPPSATAGGPAPSPLTSLVPTPPPAAAAPTPAAPAPAPSAPASQTASPVQPGFIRVIGTQFVDANCNEYIPQVIKGGPT